MTSCDVADISCVLLKIFGILVPNEKPRGNTVAFMQILLKTLGFSQNAVVASHANYFAFLVLSCIDH